MKRLLAIALLFIPMTAIACIECSGYENVHFVHRGPHLVIVEINGERITFVPKPGHWTQIDPFTGKITQTPIPEYLKQQKALREAQKHFEAEGGKNG